MPPGKFEPGAQSLDLGVERFAGAPEPRRHRAAGDADELGYLRELKLFDLVKNEDGALIELERREDPVEQEPFFAHEGCFLGIRAACVQRFDLRIAGTGAPERSSPARFRGDEQCSLEQECLLAARLELREPACRHLEHLLGGVVDRGLGDAEAPQRAPDEAEVLASHRREARVAIQGSDQGGFADGGATGGQESSTMT